MQTPHTEMSHGRGIPGPGLTTRALEAAGDGLPRHGLRRMAEREQKLPLVLHPRGRHLRE